MGLLGAALIPRAESSSPPPAGSDFWYSPDPSGFVLETGAAGLAVGPDTIMRCGTVLAAVRFRGDSWAMCPPSTYIRTDDGRQEDPTHYTQVLLRNPNPWQTGNRWRHLNGVWMATWGNAYSEIRGGRRSWAEELWPLHPRYVRVADQRADGTLVYRYTPGGGEPRTLGQERVLHFRDISTDGIVGLEMYRLIRNTVGVALMAEQHAATFLRKGARVSGLLVPQSPLQKEQRRELRESVNEEFGGSSKAGTIGVLPFGVELKELSKTNRESQFVELDDRTVGAILRFLGVPGVVVGWMGDKTSTYASAKEFFESGGIKHTVLPILSNVEAEEEKTLLRPGDSRQIKHNLDALLRASFKERIDGLTKATGGPFMAVNEARRIEDMNAIEGEQFDRPHIPSNMMGAEGQEDDPPASPPPPRRRPPDDENEDEDMRVPGPTPEMVAQAEELERVAAELGRERERLRSLVLENAGRVLRRETETLAARAPKLAGDPEKWRGFVLEFYGGHASYVERTMRMSEAGSRRYCDHQASAVLAGGLAIVESWGQEEREWLAMLALGGDE